MNFVEILQVKRDAGALDMNTIFRKHSANHRVADVPHARRDRVRFPVSCEEFCAIVVEQVISWPIVAVADRDWFALQPLADRSPNQLLRAENFVVFLLFALLLVLNTPIKKNVSDSSRRS